MQGWTRRWWPARPDWSGTRGVIVPEIFSPAVAAALPALLAQIPGPRVALFHDAIALKVPELTPAKTVARFPAYLRELLAFDGIAAVSEDSRQTLLDYWAWLGLVDTPPVRTLPLGLDPPPAPAALKIDPHAPPVVLAVGSIEGRKNQLALLEACARRWAAGDRFALRLIGLAHPQTGRATLEQIERLRAAGCPVSYDGPVDEATLEHAYVTCAFTVYPSLIEGFGLPVLESLARGKPCVCSGRGALGEAARGGGCLTLAEVTAEALADALQTLLKQPARRQQLVDEARARPLRTWQDYTRDLLAWLNELKRRPLAAQPSGLSIC
jgi:glycosyltransferase involved in cell wall biosynthesis